MAMTMKGALGAVDDNFSMITWVNNGVTRPATG